MPIGGIEVEIDVATDLWWPTEACLNLHDDVSADAAPLGFGDPTLAGQSRNKGVDLTGGDPASVGLHHFGVRSPIHPAPTRKDRGQNGARAKFQDPQIDVAHLGDEQAKPAAVAATKSLFTGPMAFGTKHSSDLQLDQLPQAVAPPATPTAETDARAEGSTPSWPELRFAGNYTMCWGAYR